MKFTPASVLRDINAYPFNVLDGRAISVSNQYFTLTISDVTTATVPNVGITNLIACFKYTDGADVWVLPASSPTLTAPDGTVTATLAALRPLTTRVVVGQEIQFLYTETVFADTTVSVGIEYYALSQNNLYQGM